MENDLWTANRKSKGIIIPLYTKISRQENESMVTP